MKKILLLGGSMQQVIAIQRSKKLGYFTVLCDYLEDNPGRKVADKFYLVSTTDKELILDIAKKEEIDGIVCYASDPAAATQAYVAEKMNLCGNPYESVKVLSDKGLFRKFLMKNGFNVPKFKIYCDYQELEKDEDFFTYPVMLKPVDSSGSKGVVKLNSLSNCIKEFENAIKYSRSKKVIIEEFIEPYNYQVAGDGFSVNGKLKFYCFGNDHFSDNSPNPFTPVAASFPLKMENYLKKDIVCEIQKVFDLLKLKTGAYNFDIRVGKNKKVYLMEIGPRNGGNMIPQVIKYATGVDLLDYTIKSAMGDSCDNLNLVKIDGYYAYYAIHSNCSGILENIFIDDEIKQNILEQHFTCSIGDFVHSFTGSNGTIGILLMKFSSMDDMIFKINNMDKFICVKVGE